VLLHHYSVEGAEHDEPDEGCTIRECVGGKSHVGEGQQWEAQNTGEDVVSSLGEESVSIRAVHQPVISLDLLTSVA
jgi:hypothetical protein